MTYGYHMGWSCQNCGAHGREVMPLRELLRWHVCDPAAELAVLEHRRDIAADTLSRLDARREELRNG